MSESREDLSLHAKIGMIHVSVFCGFRKSKSYAAEITGGHERNSRKL
jgi:hypothetical protein